MNCGKLLAGLALGALLASPVAAQTRASEDETIVVTGTRMTRGEAFEMARRYTRAVLAIPQADQNARWADPLCIGAIGLRPEVATPLIDRIEATARNVGATVARGECAPNVLLLFVLDSDSVYAEVELKRSDLLQTSTKEQRRTLSQPGLPVRWLGLSGFPCAAGRLIIRPPWL